MVPKYPFQLHHTFRNGDGEHKTAYYNHETLLLAFSHATEKIARGHTQRVQILMVIEDTKPYLAERDNAHIAQHSAIVMATAFPFQVHHTYRTGAANHQHTIIHSDETLPAAAIYANDRLRQRNTVRVQILAVIADMKPERPAALADAMIAADHANGVAP